MSLFDMFKKKNINNDLVDNQISTKQHYTQVSYLANLEEIIKEKNFTMDMFNGLVIGQDNKLYILLKNNISKSESKYAVIVLDIDWNKCEVLHEDYYDLKIHDKDYTLAQPIKNNILLVNSRFDCDNENAIIVDYQGNLIKKLHLGVGINDCIVNNSDNIIVSYYDQGIFSDDKLSQKGLNVFDINGKIIWQTNTLIDDCYAINIDENENIWYYYYSDFKLIKTDMNKEKIYEPHIQGSSNFLITSDEKSIIFEGGYNNKNKLIIGNFKNDEIVDFKNLNLIHENENINVKFFIFRKSYALFSDNNYKIFIKRF